MTDDINVTPLGRVPDDGAYPMPWRADATGSIYDARGRQVGSMVRPDIAEVVVWVLNAAAALNEVEAKRPS